VAAALAEGAATTTAPTDWCRRPPPSGGRASSAPRRASTPTVAWPRRRRSLRTLQTICRLLPPPPTRPRRGASLVRGLRQGRGGGGAHACGCAGLDGGGGGPLHRASSRPSRQGRPPASRHWRKRSTSPPVSPSLSATSPAAASAVDRPRWVLPGPHFV
jgi:hypothetical protein